jgi:hypothetical protein
MTRQEAWDDVARLGNYIEVSCNRQRLHSALGYHPPFEVLIEFQAAATAA